MDRRSKSKPPSGPSGVRSPRSHSPNNVVIDGQIIDKEPSENIIGYKKVLLENIVEETDPMLQDVEFPMEERDHTAPLEEAVKEADENVQKFIKEISANSRNENNSESIEAIYKRSEDELRELTKFLTIIDESSKGKIVDTLINVYKKEILSCIKNISETNSSQDQTAKCKNACKSLVSSCQANSNNNQHKNDAKSTETKQVHFSDADPTGDLDGPPPESESSIIEVNTPTVQKSFNPNLQSSKYFVRDSKLTKNDENILKLRLDRPINTQFSKCKEVASPDYITFNYPNLLPNDPQPRPKTIQEQICKQFISEGIQANEFSLENPIFEVGADTVDYLKRFSCRSQNCFESRSDTESDHPLGCQLKLNKSKSDTEINQLKQRKKKHKDNKRCKVKRQIDPKTKKSHVKQVSKKPSVRFEAPIGFKKNQLINYLDQELKTGTSSNQFSQVLFETANKIIENDLSSMEIPYSDPIQIGSFNPNYLLHSLKIASQSKTDVLPKMPLEYFTTSGSDISISEEDYRKWLRKRNWTKYSFPSNNVPSIENLYSISQTLIREFKKDTFGEYGYYLEQGDVPPKMSLSESKSFLANFAETFLYEHVVVSNAMNFFLTFNAKRTRVLSKWDRCLQVLFFGVFYSLWVVLNNYVFIDPKSKKGAALWK